MPSAKWNRRQLLTTSTRLTAGALATIAARRASAQLPAPQPLADPRFTLTTTTESAPWQTGSLFQPAFAFENLDLTVDPTPLQTIQGFGACFNELGWTSLQTLPEADRESVLRELFHPSAGARFSFCRTPIAANDYATEAYSYDETPNDFDLQHFSIDHDRSTLIPFIHAAQRHQPNLRLWASPWSPPSWMKRNHFYAEAPGRNGMSNNGIRPDQIGREGEDMFIQEPRYFEAYAKYFARFITAYRAENIPVGMVMPQNEFNSAQNFPSCTWTPAGLARFLHHLGPQMQSLGVDIFFGTLERGDPKLFEAVMADPEAARYIKGIGAQWAGKNAIATIHHDFPNLPIYQSEQECGDGTNSWHYTSYCWQLMKHYFRNGASAWMYWNISTANCGRSTWGWNQNSLVSVDAAARTFRYNHDFYLLKHLTHFVDVGATRLSTSGTADDALAFRNPSGSTAILLRNELPHPQMVQLQIGSQSVTAQLPPDSISTLTAPPA
jgi:glucosylceramidase